jgi:WD domain, G-beta repeat
MTSQRSDYYGQLQANEALFPLTERIDVPPLGEQALKTVLREPARVLGVQFESDDLIDHLVTSAQDEPGALPLLADLFTDLWERMQRRGDGTLRTADRKEIIQVGAALARRADDSLAKNPTQVEVVKRLFTLRLAHVPRRGEPVRRRMMRTPERETEWQLAQTLAGPDWRLVVTGENEGQGTAEVAHEVLLKTWPALKRWLDDEREFLVWRDEVEVRRKEHDEAGGRQKREALLMGLSLNHAEQWLKMRRGDIDPPEQRFIEESTGVDRRQKEQAQFTECGLLATMSGGQIKECDFGTALLLAVEALPDLAAGIVRPHVPLAEVQADSALRAIRERAVLAGHEGPVLMSSFSPDGRRVVTASRDNTARLWDVETGKGIAVLNGHTNELSSAAFSPDGRRVVTASWDATARLWDVETGKEIAVLNGHRKLVRGAEFSPDGRRVVTASWDNTARLWDVETGKEIAVLNGHTDGVQSAAFSPDGRRVVTASEDKTARLWDVFPNTQSLVDDAKARLPRCLTQEQRARFFLAPEPPRWCITGAGHEAEKDSSKWEPKWPYHTAAWRDWLLAADEAHKRGAPQPTVPK